MMLLDRALYQRILEHSCAAVDAAAAETAPFPHAKFAGIFPADVYQRLLDCYPQARCFERANPKHHSNSYGGSTRRKMCLNETWLADLSAADHALWATVRAAISAPAFRNAVFAKVASGLRRRFGVAADQIEEIPAYPRGQLYSEIEGYRIAPHPDTREKIVTMQFAFAADDSLEHVGTEFYTRSLNPLSLLREPRGFDIATTMPFLPNCAYAFSVLNTVGLKSWHGRSTIPPTNGVRNSLLHIWYTEPDESDAELAEYQQFLDDDEPRILKFPQYRLARAA
jgi:hypothetical protein